MNKVYKIFLKTINKTLVHLFFPHVIGASQLEVSHLFFFPKEYLEFSHFVLILLHPLSPISHAQSIDFAWMPVCFHLIFFSPSRDRAHSLH